MKRRIVLFLLGLGLLLLPVFYNAPFFLHIIILIFFYIALTEAWNIMALCGKVSLGHSAFFGLGAYTSSILCIKAGVIPWIGVFPALFVTFLGAAALAIPLLRLRGPMFTLATIAFSEVLRRIAMVWREMTAGAEGLTIPFTPGWENLVFTTKVPYYYIFLILAGGSVYIMHRIYHSATGHHLRAIASDEEAAQALGINTNRVQLVGLFWSSGITGLLGVFFTQYSYMIEPEWAFSQTLFALQPALNGIIGGLGTVWGPVIGAILMTPLGEFLRSYLGALQQGLNFFIYGLVLIGVVMVLPGGIVSPVLSFLRHRDFRARQASSGKEVV
jgi:branched-chain amino acid transport system permease protein